MIIRLILTAASAAICFLGCNMLRAFMKDPRQFTNRPLLMHHHPWIGNVAAPVLTVLVLILIPINGWFISGGWGVLEMFFCWLVFMPFVKSLTTYRSSYRSSEIAMMCCSPIHQAVFGWIAFLTVTLINLQLSIGATIGIIVVTVIALMGAYVKLAISEGHRYGLGKEETHKEYHPNGKVKVESFYKDGKLDGVAKEYDENGKLKGETVFKDGKQEGVCKWYYESGRLESEAIFKNGKEDGPTKKYYECGKLKSEKFSKNGKSEGVLRLYYENGQLKGEGVYKNGSLEGVFKRYCENGQLSGEELYKRGKEDGLAKTYYETGELESERVYKDGKTEGVCKWYHKNGELLGESFYKDGKLEGTEKEYDEDGRLINEKTFKDGLDVMNKEPDRK